VEYATLQLLLTYSSRGPIVLKKSLEVGPRVAVNQPPDPVTH